MDQLPQTGCHKEQVYYHPLVLPLVMHQPADTLLV